MLRTRLQRAVALLLSISFALIVGSPVSAQALPVCEAMTVESLSGLSALQYESSSQEVTVVEDGATTTQKAADAAAAETRQLLVDSVDPLRHGQIASTSTADNDDGSQTWSIFADASTPTGPVSGGGSGFMELLEFLPEGMAPEEVFPSESAAVAPLGGATFDGGEPASSGYLGFPGPDGTVATDYSLTFPEAGTYPYFCAIHASLGQLGGALTARRLRR